MRATGKNLLVITHISTFLILISTLFCNGSNINYSLNLFKNNNSEFKAVNDTFYFMTNCENSMMVYNVMKNDIIPDSETIQIRSVFAPKNGVLTFGSNGNFSLTLPNDYSGILEFRYTIYNKKETSKYSEAEVIIII